MDTQPFTSTVHEILFDFSKFRILVVGKSGCGKSELLSHVFGVDPSSENGDLVEKLDSAVSPNIQGAFTFRENNKVTLYISSRDFTPNSDSDFDGVRDFIHERLNAGNPQQELHAIWICMDTPLGGERLNEGGVERILEVAHRNVPIIIVLTKFDLLVDSITSTETISDLGDDDEISEARETAERLLDDMLKKVSLESLLSQQLVTPVSTMAGYEDTISSLIQSTDGAIQKFNKKRTHDLPVALAWAIAQRHDLETKVTTTIEVGSKRHWCGLGNSTEFKGRILEHCLSIIHEDITTIWNIQDGSNYLGGDDFRARMSNLVEELVFTSPNDVTIPTHPGAGATFAAATANPIATIASVAEAAKWVSDVYHATPNNVACIMGYIVGLVMVLTFLSEIHQFPENVSYLIEEEVVNAIKAYLSSELLSQVHKEIRKFIATDKWCHSSSHGDVVLKEIARLLNKFHPRARDWVKKASKAPSPSISITTVSDKSVDQRAKGESVLSHPLSSMKQRAVSRRGVQEPPPDILTIVEEATKIPSSRSSSESARRPTLLIPEMYLAESSKRSPLNPLTWIRRDRHAADEEAGKSRV